MYILSGAVEEWYESLDFGVDGFELSGDRTPIPCEREHCAITSQERLPSSQSNQRQIRPPSDGAERLKPVPK